MFRWRIQVKKYDADTKLWTSKICPYNSPGDALWQHRSVAKLTTKGDYAVLWSGDTHYLGDEVYLRFYNKNNQPTSNDILVNGYSPDSQRRPAIDWIEVDKTITMAVSWESYGQDGNDYGIYSKMFTVTTS